MVRRRLAVAVAAAVLLLAALAPVVAAHQSRDVGEGRYRVTVGFVREPIYTDERNALDLIIRETAGLTGIEHLQDTLFVEITAPDGTSKKPMPIRAQFGRPGYYTSDIILTQPGEYGLRIWGQIRDVAFEETFHTHHVAPLSELRFP